MLMSIKYTSLKHAWLCCTSFRYVCNYSILSRHCCDPVISAAVSSSEDSDREARYRDIVQRRKLVDLAKAQAQEVAVLRAEVERLRMRTFPALVQVEH